MTIELTNDVVEVFWSRVRRSGPDECWEWTGIIDPAGYGRIHANKMLVAHRVAYQIHYKVVLGRKDLVYHECASRSCVNPLHLKVALSEEDRFWAKVKTGSPDDCWEWQGSRDRAGYGQFKWRKKSWRASRVAYILKHGPIPNSMCILHACDNRLCVNPGHLSAGTLSKNLQDAWDRGRRVSQARLSFRDVEEMNRLLTFMPIKRIAEIFGVSPSAIHRIRKTPNYRAKHD